MAEVRCPMCGKPNPEELEACQFCQARLKPLTAPLEPIHPGEEPTKKSTAELEKALPEWLRKARHPEQTAEGETSSTEPESPLEETPPPGEETAKEEPPDWLAGLEAEAKAEEEEIPDWLTSIRAEAAQGPLEAEERPAAEQPEEGADWLSRLREDAGEAGREGTVEAEAPVPQTGELAGELPDWLSAPEAGPVEEPESGGRNLSEWRAKIDAEETPTKAGAPAEPSTAPSEEALPGWLAETATPVEPEAKEATPIEGELPDWLATQAAGPPPGESAKQPAAVSEEGLPDWLSTLPDVEAQPEEPALTPTQEEPTQPTPPASGTPALIMDEEALPSGDVEAIFSMEMPEWLSSLGPTEKGTPAATEAAKPEEGAEGLAPAELPSWVQAMRPVEAVIPEAPSGEETEQVSEREGPLAGLSGILPAKPGIGPLRKPQAYPIKLQATESQRADAATLEEMLATEAEPHPITSPPFTFSLRTLRWIIALLLILAVGLPIVTGTQMAPMAALYPRETLAAMQEIGDLPANAPVLLAFDYEPGLSGELEAAAAPLVDHLMLRGARLTILSTSPTGSVLAERFMKTAKAEHGYQRGQQYVNLGYLPGGPAGVLDFAAGPTSAIRQTVDGALAWDTPPLQGVQKLADFAALVVLTDNAETGRVWIEQAALYLGDAPLMAVISAQAEPMIRPYYESGQVKGLVTGLAGGAAYEQAMGRPGLGRQYWDAYSIGLFLAEIMVVGGGLWSAVTAWRSRGAGRDEE